MFRVELPSSTLFLNCAAVQPLGYVEPAPQPVTGPGAAFVYQLGSIGGLGMSLCVEGWEVAQTPEPQPLPPPPFELQFTGVDPVGVWLHDTETGYLDPPA